MDKSRVNQNHRVRTQARKSVLITTMKSVQMISAGGDMFVDIVKGHCHKLSVKFKDLVVEAVSPLSLSFFHQNMASCPDLDLKQQVFEGLHHGVDIACVGMTQGGIYPNWPSVQEFSDDVSKSIESNLSIGRVIGPWSAPPCPEFVSSPLGAFQRSRNGKVRTIHDLSYPPGLSVNDHIDPEQFSLSYITVDEVARACAQFEEPPYLAKSDLTNAFQHILVNPKYWHLLGFSWKDQFYAYACLSFGCRAAPKLFDVFARALEYMAIERGSSSLTWHFLDDTITCAPTRQECQRSIEIFNQTARLAGFTLQDSKCTDASQVIEFLGIEIDTVSQTLSITNERMTEITQELQVWLGRRVCTKRELLSIVGKLAFAARVVRAGRTFLRRLIGLSKSVRCLHFKIKLNKAARADFSWWLKCIRSHNGVTIFPRVWHDEECKAMFSDASNQAMGIVYINKWTVYPYTGEMASIKDTPIHYRELMAVCVGIATFASELRDSKVILWVDNQAICQAINDGTIRCDLSMNLIRSMYYTLSMYNIECQARYINTLDNVAADALSRLDMDRFRQACPQADTAMTFPCEPEFMQNDYC